MPITKKPIKLYKIIAKGNSLYSPQSERVKFYRTKKFVLEKVKGLDNGAEVLVFELKFLKKL